MAPRSPIEQQLASIWNDVLGIENIGVHDNFFTLGGHSLLATRVMSRIREVFGLELGLRSLFEFPTVAALATRFEKARRAEQGLEVPPIEVAPRDGELELSFAQQRFWFLEQIAPGSAYHLSAAVMLTGVLDVGALRRALDAVVQRHESLRTRFRDVAGRPLQIVAARESVAMEVIELGGDMDGFEERIREDARRRFDLREGPCFRTTLFHLSEQKQVLMLSMHHIVSDGWSMGVLVRELGVLYEASLCGQPAALSEVPIQYVDYALWQRGWLRGEVLESQLGYWKDQLEGLPVLELPMDRLRPAVESHRGARQARAFDKSLSRELVELSRREGVTLFMTLLGAFQTLLCRYSGQPDVVAGLADRGAQPSRSSRG